MSSQPPPPNPPESPDDEPGPIEPAAPVLTEVEPGPIEPTVPMQVGAPTLVEAAPPGKKPESRALRRLLFVLVPLLILGVGGALGLDPFLRWLVEREARRFGITIDYDRIALGRGRVDLQGVRLRLAGVGGMRTEIAAVAVQLEGLKARAVEASGVTIALEGSAADRLLELGAWSSDNAAFFKIPGTSADVRITWIAAPGEAAWLDLTRGTLSSSGSGAIFRSPSALLLGVPVGAIGAAWAADGTTLSIGLGKEILADAPIRLDLHPSATPPTGDLVLKPIKLSDLGAPLGLSLPAPGAMLDGNATLTMGGGSKGMEVIDGSLAMTLNGWVPPHPRELDGIVYGNRTTFSTTLHVTGDRRKLTLSDTAVAAGGFKLKGGGSVDRSDDHAIALLDLRGTLACSEVARSAALGNFGSFLGKILGDVAQTTVGGSVSVSVHLEADTRDLKGAKIKQEVGVGCGLKLPKLF